MRAKRDYYEVLGVGHNADEDQIKALEETKAAALSAE